MILVTFTFQLISSQCLTRVFWPSDNFQKGFGICVVFTDFLIPATILIYCYCRILWILRQQVTSGLDNNTSVSASTKFETAQRNVIRTLLIVVLFFFLCIGYAHIFYLVYTLGYEIDWNSAYYTFSIVMVFLNCTVNPFIYLFNYKDFQRALKNLFCCSRLYEPSEESQKQAVTSTA